MCQATVAATVLWLVLLLAMNVAWLVDYKRFLHQLREKHAKHWRSLGSPSLVEDEPSYQPYGFFSYFFGRKYSELGSPETAALGDRALRWLRWMPMSLLALVAFVSVLVLVSYVQGESLCGVF